MTNARPFELRWRVENKYRSLGASFVGAALCCEEARTDNSYLLPVPASSQHKAAPTGPLLNFHLRRPTWPRQSGCLRKTPRPAR
ncbi:hypothetical protein CSW00_16450 [Pseudomonas asiatica]|nr:hypothetical protein CSW00_16450 [Pseudomonas sp. MR 02]